MADSIEPVGGLLLQKKWEDMMKYVFQAILRNMPKSERFTLGSDIRALAWEVENALIQLSMRYGGIVST